MPKLLTLELDILLYRVYAQELAIELTNKTTIKTLNVLSSFILLCRPEAVFTTPPGRMHPLGCGLNLPGRWCTCFLILNKTKNISGFYPPIQSELGSSREIGPKGVRKFHCWLLTFLRGKT